MIDYVNKHLFEQNSVEKQLTISYGQTTITNEDLFQEEFSLEESLCSESLLRLGCCEASMVKFKVANIFSPMKGQELDIKVFLGGSTGNPFRYGYYKVNSDNVTSDRQWREITAYDAMYDIINADVIDWYNTILPNDDSTVTVRAFRASFISHFGLQEAPATLVNDDMIVTKTIGVSKSEEAESESSTITESATLSGKDVITAICEINGCFGHIGRDGKFHYIYLNNIISGIYPSNSLYPSNDLYPAEANTYPISKSLYIPPCKYEDYICEKISKLQIKQEENDIGAVVGNGENTYIISGNFLAYGKTNEELQIIGTNILNKIKGVSYRPFNVDCVGNPCLEVGDAVRVPTTYQIVESYILKRTLKGIQALRDSLSSHGKEKYEEAVNSLHASIIQLKGKTNKLERTVEETKSTITDVEAGLESQIRQTAGSITATVAGTEKIWDETGYFVEYYGFGAPESQYPASEEYAGKYYLDQSSGKLYIGASIPTPDGFSYYWQPSADLPLVSAKLNTKIEQNTNSITAEVTRATNSENSLSSRIQVTVNDITAEVSRATSAENSLSSKIQITADNISSKVSKGDVVSEINQSADAIELTAGRLIITSGNFTVDSSGNVSMTGNVNATSGEIGPFTITNNGLEWGSYGTKIWANTISTGNINSTSSSSSLSIGTDGNPIYLGPYNYSSSVPRGGVYIGGHANLEKDRYLMVLGTSLIGWSSGNNIHVGDYNRSTLPNSLILNSKKVQKVNSSGSLIDIGDSTSDEREKNIISDMDCKKAIEFVMKLKPIIYQYKAEENPETHWGFGAQTTLKAMKDSGIGESRLINRNPYVPDSPVNPDNDNTFFYTMKDGELCAPYAAAIQYLLKEVKEIKKKLEETKNGKT